MVCLEAGGIAFMLALIPAYKPEKALPAYIKELLSRKMFSAVVVINDGSPVEYSPIFAEAAQLTGVTVLNHAFNQGKGAALKTGLNYIGLSSTARTGIVTIDADGQHTVDDACKVAEALIAEPDCLILGGRHFDANTPRRSRIGNLLTRHAFKWVTGLFLFDTQSGLRGIPWSMIPNLLKIEANGYEFELDMLIRASESGVPVKEIPITTVYLEGNKSSNFRPVLDSLKIYFVLLRFTFIAILSALFDYGMFILIYFSVHPSVALALLGGRIVSTAFNYVAVRRYAFKTPAHHISTLPKYLLLVCFSGVMAGLLITGFMDWWHWHVIAAKIVAELMMFVVNFLIQRDFIFPRN